MTEREKFTTILKNIFDQAYYDAKKHSAKCDWEIHKMKKALDAVDNGNDDLSDDSEYPGDRDD
ncbi:hypothetical protein AX16_009912 [Volvariella volvacea WC 439]|nr:hypothetical protein AX16_009912 [Volvariella volvacea WC 439]